MMDARIAKAEQVRGLESARDTAGWRAQLLALTGSWDEVNQSEIACLETQRDYLLATQALTPAMRDLVNQVYNLKIAQAQARAEWNFTATNSLSVQKEQVNLTNQLADAYGTAVVSSVDAAGNALGNFLTNLSSGTMSVGDAIKQLGSDFAKEIQKMVIQVLVLIAKMYILKALESSSMAAGAEGGGLVEGLQTGGSVRGPSGVDKVPIRATAGEYIHRVAAVKYYGIEAMQAINAQRIPRSAFAGMIAGRVSRPSFALASGGSVPSAPAGQSGKEKSSITFINVSDPRDIDKWASSSTGQNAILNVISSRSDTVKRMLR
jgi:hypothetical protein